MEELYSKLTKKLDPQIVSHKSKGLAANLEGIRMIEALQYEKKDLQRFLPLISQSSFNSGAPRLIKIISYTIIRNFSSSRGFEWGEIIGTILGDFDTEDKELQKNAFMTMIHFPLDIACELLNSMESVFLKYLDNSKPLEPPTDPTLVDEHDRYSKEMQNKLHWLEYLPEFLIKTYLKMENEEEEFSIKDIIKDLFIKITEYVFHSDDVLASAALKGLHSVLKTYYLPSQTKFAKDGSFVPHLSHGISNDEDSKEIGVHESLTYCSSIRPLFSQIISTHLGQFPILLYRLEWLDISVRIQFSEIPVLFFKYLYDNLKTSGELLKFTDFEEPIDYNFLAEEYLSDLSMQILEMEDLGYLYTLLDTLVKFISISEIPFPYLVPILGHCLDKWNSIAKTLSTKITTSNPLPYPTYHLLLYTQILLRTTYLLPLLKSLESRSQIIQQTLCLCRHIPSTIDRLYIMLVCFDLEIHTSLSKSKEDEAFSFRDEGWFIFAAEIISEIKGKQGNFMWEEEVFLTILEGFLGAKASIEQAKGDKESVFEKADRKYMLEAWLKMVFDFSEKWYKLLEIQDPERCDTSSLWLAFLRFLEEVAKTLVQLGETAMSSYFSYKFENIRDAVIQRTPIVGLAANSAREGDKVGNFYLVILINIIGYE